MAGPRVMLARPRVMLARDWPRATWGGDLASGVTISGKTEAGSLIRATFPSQVPGGVVGLAQAGVGSRQHHLGVSNHARYLLLFPALQAGRFGVQVTL